MTVAEVRLARRAVAERLYVEKVPRNETLPRGFETMAKDRLHHLESIRHLLGTVLIGDDDTWLRVVDVSNNGVLGYRRRRESKAWSRTVEVAPSGFPTTVAELLHLVATTEKGVTT